MQTLMPLGKLYVQGELLAYLDNFCVGLLLFSSFFSILLLSLDELKIHTNISIKGVL